MSQICKLCVVAVLGRVMGYSINQMFTSLLYLIDDFSLIC